MAYPKSNFINDTMIAIAANNETDFIKNDFDIYEPSQGKSMEPEEMDKVLMPLLTFDKEGYSLGYGKGFYDKYPGFCRNDCIKIGFSYFEPIDEIPEKLDFDVPLNYCIISQADYVF